MKPPVITEVERLLTEDQRRPLTVAAHQEFRESLTRVRHDEIDLLVEDLRAAEFEEKGAAS